MKKSRDGIFETERRLPGIAVVQSKSWNGIPNGIVYQKGGWALHMLRGQIGADKFRTGLRLYYQRFRDANASTDDFRKVMEEVSGEDLGWWFRQWIYRPGSPRLQGGWRHTAGKVELDLAQMQDGEAYRLPLEIAVGANTVRIEMTGKQQRFEIPVEQPPASVMLDPNIRMLIDTTMWEMRVRRGQ